MEMNISILFVQYLELDLSSSIPYIFEDPDKI